MGACSSCLGRDRHHELSDEDESTRLLFDDPHGNPYGTLGDQHAGIPQADPLEVQRETEALQKVVAQTSNHLVDIFALVSQNSIPTAAVLPAHDARYLRYQGVLAKMSSKDQASRSNGYTNETSLGAMEGWVSEDEEIGEMKSCKPVKSDGIGSILGGFADAESALK